MAVIHCYFVLRQIFETNIVLVYNYTCTLTYVDKIQRFYVHDDKKQSNMYFILGTTFFSLRLCFSLTSHYFILFNFIFKVIAIKWLFLNAE